MTLKTDADCILKELSLSWKSNDSGSILALMKQYNVLMQQLDEKYQLGIYTKEHQTLANLTSESGLLYKPSGAGGGDLGLILTNNEMRLKQIVAKLKDNNFQTLDLI